MTEQYQTFFVESDAGKSFIDWLNDRISAEHELAENEPELARDHVQRAKGIREVVSHIQSMTAKTQKPYKMM